VSGLVCVRDGVDSESIVMPMMLMSMLMSVSGAGLHGGESSRTFPSEIQRSFG